jgi:hypothetical protein
MAIFFDPGMTNYDGPRSGYDLYHAIIAGDGAAYDSKYHFEAPEGADLEELREKVQRDIYLHKNKHTRVECVERVEWHNAI